MSRMDSLDHEEVDVCTKTNYAGYVYWGEYSLCFAAVLNQEECFRLILSRGINLDKSNLSLLQFLKITYIVQNFFSILIKT